LLADPVARRRLSYEFIAVEYDGSNFRVIAATPQSLNANSPAAR
jgi:hypothetical protein